VNELVCLVTQTNFNTLRGKFLRAIRFQSKQTDTFFKETIIFIYILIIITTIVYFGYLSIVGPYTSNFTMFIVYIDLIFTAIPPTLPTILMLGIEFVVGRL
jgi:cation-transporting ATPase 13A2